MNPISFLRRDDPYRKARLPLRSQTLLALAALAIMVLLELIRGIPSDPLKPEKTAAKELMIAAMGQVRAERLRLEIPIDAALDPAGTGLIGAAYNDLTTTRGSLASKRTSVNPEFAAIIVEMLADAGVRSGDPVAVSFSGSFPALNIAVLSAASVLQLQPVIISSVGSSMYGANFPELTWIDMERLLREKGLLPYRSIAASLGGIADTKGGLDGTGIGVSLRAMRRSGIPVLPEGGDLTLQEDVRRRLDLYDRALEGRKPAAFINVGGASTSLGLIPGVDQLPTGLMQGIPQSHDPDRGMIFQMHERGIPVIHLLRIRTIAAKYGIPFDPVFTGSGTIAALPRTGKYSMPLAAVGIIFLLGLTVYLRKRSCPAAFPLDGR